MKITTIILTLFILVNFTSCKSPEKQVVAENQSIINENTAHEDAATTKKGEEYFSKPKEDSIKVEENSEPMQEAQPETGIEMLSEKEELPKVISRPLKELEEEVMSLINMERQKKGLKPYKSDYTCYDSALLRAKECEEYWSHTRPNGEEWYSLYFNNPNANGIKMVGENLGRNFTNAKTIVDALMNSEGHRKNILHPRFTHVCIAIIEMKPSEEYSNKTLYAMTQHFYFKEEL